MRLTLASPVLGGRMQVWHLGNTVILFLEDAQATAESSTGVRGGRWGQRARTSLLERREGNLRQRAQWAGRNVNLQICGRNGLWLQEHLGLNHLLIRRREDCLGGQVG